MLKELCELLEDEQPEVGIVALKQLHPFLQYFSKEDLRSSKVIPTVKNQL